MIVSVLMEKRYVSGSRRGTGEELGPHGLHLCGVPAVSHPRVSGGVEYGEPGRDLPRCYRRVSFFNVLSNINVKEMSSRLRYYICIIVSAGQKLFQL